MSPRNTLVILITAVSVLTGCSGGDEPADGDASDPTTGEVTPATDVTLSSAPVTAAPSTPAPTEPTATPVTTTTEPYDETARTPLGQLADRFAATVARQDGDPDVARCVVDAVIDAWTDGELSPVDVDEYARAGRVTEAMAELLASLQASGGCSEPG